MKLKKPKSFTINRKTWARGAGRNMLLDGLGTQCCLGFYGGACGVTDEQLIHQGAPSDVWDDHVGVRMPGMCLPRMGGASFTRDSALSELLMGVNDNAGLSEPERERLVVKEFNKIGVEVKFIN